jgi:hypothetical protein
MWQQATGGSEESQQYSPPPEADEIPERILMVPDDWQTQYVGTLEDGRHFFLTNPFQPGIAEYVAVFYWNADGSYDSMVVDDLGARDDLEQGDYDVAMQARLDSLGDYTLEQISVAPFQEEHDGVPFGLIPFQSDGYTWVSVMPGDYVAYSWPWDGVYDT